jgi:hypothetical protein
MTTSVQCLSICQMKLMCSCILPRQGFCTKILTCSPLYCCAHAITPSHLLGLLSHRIKATAKDVTNFVFSASV